MDSNAIAPRCATAAKNGQTIWHRVGTRDAIPWAATPAMRFRGAVTPTTHQTATIFAGSTHDFRRIRSLAPTLPHAVPADGPLDGRSRGGRTRRIAQAAGDLMDESCKSSMCPRCGRVFGYLGTLGVIPDHANPYQLLPIADYCEGSGPRQLSGAVPARRQQRHRETSENIKGDLMGRIAMDLTDAASTEVDRIVSITDLKSRPDVFRSAFTLLRIHVDAARRGERVFIETDNPTEKQLVVLPFNVALDRQGGGTS